MSETQIPLMALLAFLGGCFAGAWIGKSNSIGVLLLFIAIISNIAGWMSYGLAVNWKPEGGIRQIVSGVLIAGPGMALFATVPALVGFSLGAFVVKIILRKRKPGETGGPA